MGDPVTILIDLATILPQPLFVSWVLCRLLPMRCPTGFILLFTGAIVTLHGLFMWVWLIPAMAKMAVMLLAAVSLSCLFSRREARLPALSITLLYTALLILAEFLTIFFLLLLLNAGPGRSMEEHLLLIVPNLLTTRCAYTALLLLILLPFYLLWKKLLWKDTVRSVPELLPFLMVHSAMLLMGELLLLMCGHLSPRLLPAALITAVRSCGALAAVLWTYHQEQQRHRLQLNNQSLVLQNRALELEQASADDQKVQVRSMQKELRNRLREICAPLSQRADRAAQEQIFQTAQWLQLHTSQRYCENLVVNSVMMHQALRCRTASIRLNCTLQLPRSLDIGEAELCSVFSNLMDNAVRACTALPEEDRQIHLSAALKGAYLIIRSRNPMSESPIFKEAGGHGLGLGILEEITRWHDGALEISRENKQFSVTLWLRLGALERVSADQQAIAGEKPGHQTVLWETALPLCMLPLSQLGLIAFILHLWQQSGQPVHWSGLVLMLILGLAADLLLFQLFQHLKGIQDMRERALLLESEFSARKRYLEQLGETSLQLARLRHDMNNHLQTLSHLIGTGALDEAGRYAQELAELLPSGLWGEEES